MDILLFGRSMAGLFAVLAILAGALVVVRRYDLALPGRVGGGKRGRVGIVERVTIDGKRTLLLVRHDAREHLILMAPEGHVVLEQGAAPAAEAATPVEQPLSFPALVGSEPHGNAQPSFNFEPWLAPADLSGADAPQSATVLRFARRG